MLAAVVADLSKMGYPKTVSTFGGMVSLHPQWVQSYSALCLRVAMQKLDANGGRRKSAFRHSSPEAATAAGETERCRRSAAV